ncbi:MAG: endolytic transglycosylase MltG [bacterium]
MKILKSAIVFLLSILVLALIFIIYSDSPADRNGETRAFNINYGETAAAAGMRLKQQHFIRSASFFRLLTLIQHKETKIQPGQYTLSPSMNTQEILSVLTAHNGGQMDVRITIPEGFTASEIAERMDEAGLCDYDEWMDIVSAPEAHFINLRSHEIESLEGFLFPDTYFFHHGAPCERYIQKMTDRFFDIFTEKYINEAGQQDFTLPEIVTLASLVEEEAKLKGERRTIAGVLRNRLEREMLLQCDATVQYALPERKERLLYEDLKIDSPYNTYLYKGLPPGPICNPGLDSLLAALHPAAVPFLYYVARPDGSHIFSVSGEEHLDAVMKLRRERANKQY